MTFKKNHSFRLIFLLLLLAIFTKQAHAYPYCNSTSSDPDGDGWGWENGQICVVCGSITDQPYFVDRNATCSNDTDDGPIAGIPGCGQTNKFVGNITQAGRVPDDFGKYWDQITCENAGKWGAVEPSRNNMNWSGIDRAYNFAKQNSIPYKHHTFVWGSASQGWLSGLSNEEQRKEVEEWIQLYCERYPDTEMINVVNEPDHSPPIFSYALGGAGETGYDWVIWSFETARQYCPDSILILNDYSVLRWETNNFVSIANILKQRGLIDAIGAQAHFLEDIPFSELQNNFNQVAEVGLPIYISEYDVNIADDDLQREVMEEQFTFFYNSKQVAGITLWGYVYGQTWRANTGLIRDGNPRPAMTWLMDFLDR
ncbi:MAG: endo-1,4-beta-xylanase [Desulfobacteraceae bacterium]|jgi:GH35 family endo-1,4-beta-xylanase